MMIYDNPDMASVQRVVGIFEYLCFSVLTVMPMPFLLHCCGENQEDSMLLRAAIMLWCVFCIMLSVTQFTDMFYYISSDNQYIREPLFPLMIFPLAMVMIMNTANLIRKRKKLSKRVFILMRQEDSDLYRSGMNCRQLVRADFFLDNIKICC